ncbi:MAG: SDR family NAD(P)-dependent oxidoreductase, partial [Verrucomicrobiota bacterium]
MSQAIEGKIALVTGANRGIGKSYVDVFIAHGAAKVYAGVRDLSTAEPLVKAHGDRVVPLHLDLADGATIEKAAETAKDVTIVINNGGVLT